MSERIQHTAASMAQKMSHRYGEKYLHKHDKRHTTFRKHWKTHPVTTALKEEQDEIIKTASNLFRAKAERKIWKRLAKDSIH